MANDADREYWDRKARDLTMDNMIRGSWRPSLSKKYLYDSFALSDTVQTVRWPLLSANSEFYYYGRDECCAEFLRTSPSRRKGASGGCKIAEGATVLIRKTCTTLGKAPPY